MTKQYHFYSTTKDLSPRTSTWKIHSFSCQLTWLIARYYDIALHISTLTIIRSRSILRSIKEPNFVILMTWASWNGGIKSKYRGCWTESFLLKKFRTSVDLGRLHCTGLLMRWTATGRVLESLQLLQLQLVSFRLEQSDTWPPHTTAWCGVSDSLIHQSLLMLTCNLQPTPRTKLDTRGCEMFSQQNPWRDIFIRL